MLLVDRLAVSEKTCLGIVEVKGGAGVGVDAHEVEGVVRHFNFWRQPGRGDVEVGLSDEAGFLRSRWGRTFSSV